MTASECETPDGLTPPQRANLDALLLRMDALMDEQGTSNDARALARIQTELNFYATLHLDNNTRCYISLLKEDILDVFKVVENTVDLTKQIAFEVRDRIGVAPADDARTVIERLAEVDLTKEIAFEVRDRIGVAPADDPRTVIARLAEVEARQQHHELGAGDLRQRMNGLMAALLAFVLLALFVLFVAYLFRLAGIIV